MCHYWEKKIHGRKYFPKSLEKPLISLIPNHSQVHDMTGMKDWDKEQMTLFFDTTELLKQRDDESRTERKKPQEKGSSIPIMKMKKNRRDEHKRRILPLRAQFKGR